MAKSFRIYLANYSDTSPGILIATAYVHNGSVDLSFENGQDSYFQEQPGEIERLISAVLNGANEFVMKGWSSADKCVNNAWPFIITPDDEQSDKHADNE